MKKTSTRKFRKLLGGLESFFSSWRFPVFMLSVLFFFVVLVITITAIPVSESAAGTFAEEFKRWCMGYDPATGEIEYIYLIVFIVQPIILSTFILMFWYAPIKKMLRKNRKQSLPYISAALILVIAIGLSLPSLYSNQDEGELPFPANSLRTEIPPPDFTLVNQRNKKVDLNDYRDKVVLITAVYASCNETCPVILENAKELFKNLEPAELQEVELMALTMDPNKDTPKMLGMTADHYGLDAQNQHLLTGEAQQVNRVLDQLNIPRNRRADGAIDHANLFVLIDKKGKIAYRFTLGDRQQQWLLKATRLLIKEQSQVADSKY